MVCGSFAVILASNGCGGLGPATVTGDHFSFNNAVSKSSNEQLLLNIVRLQAGKPVYCVEIESMVSEYRLATNAEISRRQNDLHGSFGPALRAAFPNRDDPVPDPTTVTTVRANLRYSQTPTITYRPVEGGKISERMLAPVSTTILNQLVRSGWGIDRVLSCCVQQVNEFSNRMWLDAEETQVDRREYFRLVELARILHQAGELRFEDQSFDTYLSLPAESAAHARELAELKELLGCPVEGATRLRLISNGPRNAQDEIAVQTRSVNGIMSVLAWESFGNTQNVQENGGPWLCLKRAILPTKDAFAKVRFEGNWYYIAKDDWRSKRTFAMLSSLFTLLETNLTQIDDSANSDGGDEGK